MGWIPVLSPNKQYQSTEENYRSVIYHYIEMSNIYRMIKDCRTLYLPLSTFCTGKREGQIHRRCCWRISSCMNSESETTLDGSPQSRATTLCRDRQRSIEQTSCTTSWQL